MEPSRIRRTGLYVYPVTICSRILGLETSLESGCSVDMYLLKGNTDPDILMQMSW